MPPNAVVIIPARMESSRLPNKPAQTVDGKPLVWYAWRNAVEWTGDPERVIIATDSSTLYDLLMSAGIKEWAVAINSVEYRNGTQRVLANLDHDLRRFDAGWVVNLQCDEPEVTPEMLDQLIETRRKLIQTLACQFNCCAEMDDPNHVKVVMNRAGRALYFTRSTIPLAYRHIGVYAFHRNGLRVPAGVAGLAQIEPSPLAEGESLEQLEWMDADWEIQVIEVDGDPISVNTPEDLERFRERVES